MSTTARTTEPGGPPVRRYRQPLRPRRSVKATTLRSTAIAVVAALLISIGLAGQMAAGHDPALGKKAKPAVAQRGPAQPAPAPVVTRSS